MVKMIISVGNSAAVGYVKNNHKSCALTKSNLSCLLLCHSLKLNGTASSCKPVILMLMTIAMRVMIIAAIIATIAAMTISAITIHGGVMITW